ncbi:MAG: Ig domain-containing protein [Acidobacteriota bacterium]
MKPRHLVVVAALGSSPVLAQWNTPENLGAPPNDNTSQESAVLSPDGRQLIVNCTGSTCAGNNTQAEDMVEFTLSGGAWGSRTELTLTNSTKDDYAWGWTMDGTLWLTSYRPSAYGTIDFYQAVKAGGQWQAATLMPQPVNSAVSTNDDNIWGSVLPDGKTLYMTAYRSGTPRSVYVTRKVGNTWTALSEVSSQYLRNKSWVAVSPDEQHMYVDGVSIQGSQDLFESVKVLGVWQNPTLIDLPVSSINTDQYGSITSLGGGLTFVSNRIGGSGGYDVWHADRTLAQIHPAMPNGYVNTAYGQVIPFWGGHEPYTIVRTGALPPGLSLDTSTGYVSGIPTSAGIWTFTIDIQDSNGSIASGAVILRIYAAITDCNILTGNGPQASAPAQVRMFKANGTLLATSVTAFSGGYGVNVAAGQVDSDTVAEILASQGPGPSNAPQVRGFESTGTAISKINFFAYASTGYGTNVNAALLDADGYQEILTAPGPGSIYGPQVRGWNYDGSAISAMGKVNFYAYGTLRYGANVAAGDLDSDGFDEMLTGPGPGAVFSCQLKGWNFDGASVSPMSKINAIVFSGNYGLNVAAGELDRDPYDEILASKGPDPTFNDDFAGFDYDATALKSIINQAATYGNQNVQGVRCWACDLDSDGIEEILTAPRTDPASLKQIRGWSWDGGPLQSIATTQFDQSPTYGASVSGGDFGF